jgi:hypothetical protein
VGAVLLRKAKPTIYIFVVGGSHPPTEDFTPYDISGDMVTGRNAAVLFIDPSNFSYAVIIAV